jgi:ribosomal protein S18 acetylase RimI-like enzyme
VRSTDEAVAAIDANFLEYWRTVCRHLPTAELHDGPDAVWFVTGIPFFPFNQVLRATFRPEAADARIDALLAQLHARRVPFCWNVPPTSRPADLAARLDARQHERTNDMPAMTLDLARPLDGPAPPERLAVTRVRDAAGLGQWATAYRDAFGLPQAFVDALGGAYAGIGFADDAPFRHYVGLLDGEPVACSTVFFHDGVAALWHIATLPAHRRRGIGAALTVAPLRDARELGCRTAALFASEMGAPLYERLGFRERFRLIQFGWGDSP